MAPEFVPLVVPPEGVEGPAYHVLVRTGEVLADPADEILHTDLRQLDGLASEDPVFLGLLDGRPVWASGVEPGRDAVDGTIWAPLLALAARVPDAQSALAGRAVQLVEWARTAQFCGRCGQATELVVGERARRCPVCGLLAYPRLAPAVITLVEREGEVLLAQGRNFGVPMYSCLAGFVEPGETLEEAVHREVLEEVGVKLGPVRYFGSQPWPFPHQLMIGFVASWESGDIVLDETEIVDAGWYTADALPMVPPPLSIARRLIDDWLRRQA
jgi:NAD+ diphosphatase